jgi:pimeloyl-ACP methyl ester carboxylesterase
MQVRTKTGIAIEYDEFGDPGAPVILLIMGLGTQMINWPEPFCMKLAEQGNRVIRFDNRDVGLSQKFDGLRAPGPLRVLLRNHIGLPLKAPYSLTDMAQDALGLMDALNIEQAHIVGASMGGMIAQIMAAEYQGRVMSLTTIMSSSGRRGLPGADLEITRHLVSRPEDKAAQFEYSMRTWQLIGSPGYPSSQEDVANKVSGSLDRSHYPAGFKRQLAAIAQDGSRVERLKRITAPTLVIHGTADRLVPAAASKDIARHVPGARLELIEGMGHDLPRALWSQLAALITDHAARV